MSQPPRKRSRRCRRNPERLLSADLPTYAFRSAPSNEDSAMASDEQHVIQIFNLTKLLLPSFVISLLHRKRAMHLSTYRRTQTYVMEMSFSRSTAHRECRQKSPPTQHPIVPETHLLQENRPPMKIVQMLHFW